MLDWNLVREFAQYIVRIRPEEFGGHFMLARASRHLGDIERAREEFRISQDLLTNDAFKEDYSPQVQKEERLLSGE